MADLRTVMDHQADEVRAAPDAYAAVLRRVERRRRRRTAGTIAAALVIAAAGAVTAVLAFGGFGASRPASEDSVYRGVRCLSEDEPGLITCHDAIDRAGSPEDYSASSADAQLEMYRARPGERAVRIWDVTYHDAITTIHGPPGRTGPDCAVGDWSVAIDARTGAPLVEGGSGKPIPCPIDGRPWTRYELLTFGSAVAVPPGWRVQEFDEDIGGLFSFVGVVLTNVDFTFEHPDLGPDQHTSAWDMEELPSNAVVVMFSHGVRLAFCNPNRPDTDFPLRFEDLRPVPRTPEDTYGAPEPRYYRPVTVGGDPHYQVDVWFAPDATREARELAEDVVASIEHPDPLTCENRRGPAESPTPSPTAR